MISKKIDRGLLITLMLIAVMGLISFTNGAFAQSYRKGQHVEPAYEGWWENDDGTFSFIFGYFILV